MAIYKHKCHDCEKIKIDIRPITEDKEIFCDSCGSKKPMYIVIQPVGVLYNCGGFSFSNDN